MNTSRLRITIVVLTFSAAVLLLFGRALIRTPESFRKMSVELERRLAEAGDGEFIDAIVTMGSVLPSDSLSGRSRSEVVTKLEDYAMASQSGLLNFLGGYESCKVSAIKQFWLGNCVSISATKDVIRAVASRTDVAAVRENGRYWNAQAFDFVSAPAQTPVWDHQNMMGLDEVWRQFGTYGKGIVVAVLDAGVDPSHPDLSGKMASGGWAEFRRNGSQVSSSPTDSSGHGTAVTSIIVGGNASGFNIGVAPEAKFLHAKIMNQVSGKWAPTISQIKAGIEWAVSGAGHEGADIVVFSFNTDKPGVIENELEQDLQTIVNAGVIPIGSVGNVFLGFDDPCSVDPNETGSSQPPGNSSSCIGVGGVKHLVDTEVGIQLDLYENSSCGAAVGGQRKPNLVAPGKDIFAAWPDGQWRLVTGTSGAAPRVAGIAALMLQCSQGLGEVTGEDRKRLVKKALDNVASTVCPSGMDGHGYPRNYENEWCTLPCPNPYYGSGALQDSMAMWNLEYRDSSPYETLWQLVWRKLTGSVVDTEEGRSIQGATALLNTGQRVYTNQDGVYSVRVEAGRWRPAYQDFVTRVDTLQITRAPFPTVTDTVQLDASPWEPPVMKNFVLDASGILEISGYVRDVDGNPVPNVAVSGFPIGQTITNAAGFYRDFVPSGWTGILKPATPDYDLFLPDSLVFQTPVTSDLVDQNFTINARRVSGVVTSAITPLGPAEGLIVDAIEDGLTLPTASDATDVDGSYELALPPGWTGAVSPRYRGLYNEFSPSSYQVSVATEHLVDRDFTAAHQMTQWLEDGLLISEETPGDQRLSCIVTDGSGGAIVVYGDSFAQKILNNGDVRWTRGGFALPHAGGRAAPDGTGGVLLAGDDAGQVWAQRVGPNEERLWGPGIAAGSLGPSGGGIGIVGDGTGGAYVSRIEGSGSYPFQVYLTRLLSSGEFAWPTPVHVGASYVSVGDELSLVGDGAGGVIVTWEEWVSPGTTVNLRAQRISGSRAVLWGSGGILVKSALPDQTARHASLADGEHGVIVVWNEGSKYIVQRIGSGGSKMWGADGVEVGGYGEYDRPALTTDGVGGVIVAWGNTLNWSGIGVQRINAQGNVLWGPNGMRLYEGDWGLYPCVVSDGFGGAIASWAYDYPTCKVRAQRVGPNGAVLWSSSGLEVTSSLSYESDHKMVSDGAHGAIIAWTDDRLGSDGVYAKRIGEAAVPVAVRGCLRAGNELIAFPDTFVVGCPAGDKDTLVVEVDFDNSMLRSIAAEELTLGMPEGSGSVSLHWRTPPTADSDATAPDYRTTITHPFIGGCAAAALDSVPVLLNGATIGFANLSVKSPDLNDTGQVTLADLSLFASTYPPFPNCPSQPGYIDCANYSKPAGSSDSCVVLPDLSVFASHYNCYYDTNPPQGASLGPVVRRGADVIFEPRLSDKPKSDGVASFSLRIANADSIGLLGMVITTPQELQFAGFTASAGFEDRLMVVRKRGPSNLLSVIVVGGAPIIGNAELGTLEFKCESEPSLDQLVIVKGEALRTDGTFCTIGVAGAATTSAATVVYRNFLGWNRPNPFNPTTTIEYSIEKDSPVHLCIYNVRGQLVQTLVSEYKPRGTYEVSWDATNNSGDPVASGVYWYKLETPDFTDAKKLTILR